MIEANGLVKRFGARIAVDNVTFEVADGETVGFLGPNGAGKTTIMRVLTTYYHPSAGTVKVGGYNVMTHPEAVKSTLGYLPEGVPLYLDMTVLEYLQFAASVRGMDKIKTKEACDKAITACSLSSVAQVRIEHLSKGYRQRTGLAQAILHDPDILILDEPTTGLDPNQILEIRALIRSLGAEKTVILSTHILQEVEALCAEVLILNEGRIVAQGSAGDIAASMQAEVKITCILKNCIASALESLSSAHSVEKRESGLADLTEICVSGKYQNHYELSEIVFDWAASNGIKLLEMHCEKMSMEDIFVKLTAEDKS
jgi:ABC-2 type transport system ATP-binding protein